MSLEKNKAIVRRLYEADNKKDLSILDDLVSPDFFDPQFGLKGPVAYKAFETEFFKGFPDWQETIQEMAAEGDKVWVDFKAEGTHKGEWKGLAPTGKKINASCVQIWRIANGKVVQKDSIIDWLDALKQLGIIEFTDKAKMFQIKLTE